MPMAIRYGGAGAGHYKQGCPANHGTTAPVVGEAVITLGPPRYYAPVCIQWPWGFTSGPAGYREVTEAEKGRGPIVVEPNPKENP